MLPRAYGNGKLPLPTDLEPPVPSRADLAPVLPKAAWQWVSCGDGAKGRRFCDWALIATSRPEISLLIRRSIARRSELAFYLCHTPRPVPLAVLVKVAGVRWSVEECFQAGKNDEAGLDHNQVRLYRAWYRCVTLAMLALAWLAVTRASLADDNDDDLMTSANEIRRIFTALCSPPPDEVQFATKPELARAMLGRALDAGVPATWVTADEAYGRDGKFRAWLEQRRAGYVVAVDSRQAIAGDAGTSRAGALAAHAPDRAWKRRSCGDDAKGPRMFDWAAATLPDDGTAPPGWSRYLLIRRSPARNAKGERELAYYLCAAPAGTADEELIRVAGSRWAIEECFQTAKNETGLDHYQVRRYGAWYRHATLAMLAHAYLAVTAATAPKALAAASSRSRSARSAVSWHT